jgi:hypothetical protein
MVKFASFVFVAGMLAAFAAASSAFDVNDFERSVVRFIILESIAIY